METARFRTHDGLSLFYRTFGDAERARRTALCLHGLTRNSKDFIALAEHLSDPAYGGPAGPFRVICPDLRGRGQSDHDPDWKNYNPAVYVRDTWALLDDLGIRNVSVIGTSLGGIMAMIMAWQRPQRLNAIVLNDIGPHISPAGIKRILGYAGKATEIESWDEATAQVRAKYEIAYPAMPDSFWRDYARRTFRENESGRIIAEVDPNIRLAIQKAARSGRFLRWIGRLRILRAIRGVPVNPWDTFKAITMPCLVLRGEFSDVLSRKTVDEMSRVKSDLKRVTVSGRGHVPLLDEPEAMDAIDDFLAATAVRA